MTEKKIRMLAKAGPMKAARQKGQQLLQSDLSWNTANDDTVRMTVRTQDEAVVVSADFHLQGNRERLMAVLQTEMEQMAAKVTASGGIVGHIKASVECSETAVISVTLDKADVRTGNLGGISGKFAAIVLLLEETRVRELAEAMFAAVKENIKDAVSGENSR